MSDWVAAVPAIAAALGVFLIPGAAIAVAFGLRGMPFIGAVPLASMSVVGVTTVAAHVLPFSWGPIPVAIATIVLAGLVVLVRVLLSSKWDVALLPDGRAYLWAVGAAVILAAVLIGIRLATMFGAPEHISQTFDNVYHLNAVRYILDTGDASPFRLGSLTYDLDGVPSYYPGGWHAVVALVSQLSGASIPVAVNATNLIIGAVVWPVGAIVLARVGFGRNPLAALLAAVVSAGLGAFPYLLVDFGVLYPNMLSIALLPGALSVVVVAAGLAVEPTLGVVPRWMLLVAVLPGLALAHPSTLIALVGLSVPITGIALFRLARRFRGAGAARWRWWVAGIGTLLGFAAGAGLFLVVRPAMWASFWGPWTDPVSGLFAAIGSAPQNTPPSFVIAALTVVGIVAILVRRRGFWMLGVFAISVILYVIAVSAPIGVFRYLMVGTWYNDTNRLAALLPVATLPLVVAGGLWLTELVTAWIGRRASPHAARDRMRAIVAVGAVLVAGVTVATQAGDQLADRTASASALYRLSPDSPLLSTNEAALLERIDDEVPEGVVVAGNPWNGASLVYALADRRPLLPAIFGDRRGPVAELMESLRDADHDPAACDAIREANVGFVLDFGGRDVHPGDHTITGFSDLAESEAVRLVDREGDALLYEVTACR